MMQIISDSDSNIVYTISSEKLTREDYDRLLPIAEQKIEEKGSLRWYFEMENFSGWKPDAFWEDVKFDVKHVNDFEKIAMVGDKQWENWMTQAMKPFTGAAIKYFDITERASAKDWIRQ